MDFDDIVKIVDQVKVLEARLAAVEAERDAARAKRDAARAEVAHMKREQQAMIMQHRHDIRDLGQLLQDERCKVAVAEAERDAAQKRVQDCETRMMRYAIQLGEMQSERDAARAGEARAVEALRRCHEGAARQLAEPRDHNDDQYALTAIATDCEAVLADSAIALDWLAQQRREAVAAWIEKQVAENLERYGTHYYERTTDDLMREAAAFRAASLRAGEVGDE